MLLDWVRRHHLIVITLVMSVIGCIIIHCDNESKREEYQGHLVSLREKYSTGSAERWVQVHERPVNMINTGASRIEVCGNCHRPSRHLSRVLRIYSSRVGRCAGKSSGKGLLMMIGASLLL